MKDIISKRRYYLNRKEKNNTYNTYNDNISNEKNDFLNLKKELNKTKEKEINSQQNINKFDRNKKYIKDESNKQNNIKNFILYSNNNESNKSQKDSNKKTNYFRFSMPNKIILSPNNYVNASNKINNNNKNYENQGQNKFNLKNYNKSFEMNIKPKVKNEFKEKENDNRYLFSRNHKNENKMNSILSNVKIKNNFNEEKVKKEKKNVNSEKKLGYFPSFYKFITKKKEIIKIQSVWRGYYFRIKKGKNIKQNLILNSGAKFLVKFVKNKIKILYNEFIKVLNNYIKRKDEIGAIENINLLRKNYNAYAKRHFTSNNNQNTRNNNNDNNSLRNKTNSKNIKDFSKLTGLNEEINNGKVDKKDNKEKNINDIDDIFNSPIKIIYVPKKIDSKNRYYYMKRMTNIKKLKLEKFFKFIKKKYLYIYFTIFKNRNKLNSNFFKIKKLISSIDSIFKKNLGNYFQMYRDKILDIKVKEEIMKKKTLSIINENNNNIIKLSKQRRVLNANKKEKKIIYKIKKEYRQKYQG